MFFSKRRGRRAQLMPEHVTHVLRRSVTGLGGDFVDRIVRADQQALRQFDAQGDDLFVD